MTPTRRLSAHLAIPAAVATVAGTMSARGQTFHGLGIYPPDQQSWATGALRNGLGAIGYSYAPLPPFLYHGLVVRTDGSGSVTGSTVISATNNVFLHAASRSGSVVVGQVNGAPARCDGATGAVSPLGTLPGASASGSAFACDSSGNVIAGTAVDAQNRDRAFRTIGGGPMEQLTQPAGAYESAAVGASADGRVIVGEVGVLVGMGFGSREVVRWRDGVPEELGWLDPVGRDTTYVQNVSADGRVIIGYGYGSNWAFVGWRHTAAAGFQLLPAPCSGTFFPYGLSADGAVIVGGINCNNGEQRAGLWTAALGVVDLQAFAAARYGMDFGGWTLQGAGGVSADGLVIVGGGTDPSGASQAWMLRLPSIPGNCRVDANGDGAVNVQDFLVYLTFYSAADARADMDADGAVNVQDFLAFLSGYAAGCAG